MSKTHLVVRLDDNIVVNVIVGGDVAPEGFEFVERSGDNARVGVGFVRENGVFRAPTPEECQAFRKGGR